MHPTSVKTSAWWRKSPIAAVLVGLAGLAAWALAQDAYTNARAGARGAELGGAGCG